MRYDEKWSYSYDQLEEYILGRGAKKEEGSYLLEDCVVYLEALPPRRVGRLEFPVTGVIIEGTGAESFYRGFFLRFLSGGG